MEDAISFRVYLIHVFSYLGTYTGWPTSGRPDKAGKVECRRMSGLIEGGGLDKSTGESVSPPPSVHAPVMGGARAAYGTVMVVPSHVCHLRADS
jgi:hypothetical protein